jgi:hypothetical protein
MKHVKTPEQSKNASWTIIPANKINHYTELINDIKVACINVWNSKSQITYCTAGTAYIINDAGRTLSIILNSDQQKK